MPDFAIARHSDRNSPFPRGQEDPFSIEESYYCCNYLMLKNHCSLRRGEPRRRDGRSMKRCAVSRTSASPPGCRYRRRHVLPPPGSPPRIRPDRAAAVSSASNPTSHSGSRPDNRSGSRQARSPGRSTSGRGRVSRHFHPSSGETPAGRRQHPAGSPRHLLEQGALEPAKPDENVASVEGGGEDRFRPFREPPRGLAQLGFAEGRAVAARKQGERTAVQHLAHRTGHPLAEAVPALRVQAERGVAGAQGPKGRMAAIRGAPQSDLADAGLDGRGDDAFGHPALEFRRSLLSEGGNQPALGAARHRSAGEYRDLRRRFARGGAAGRAGGGIHRASLPGLSFASVPPARARPTRIPNR